MKTKAWHSPATTEGLSDGAPSSPVDWLKTPVYFTTLTTQPQELEIMSGVYRVWKCLRDKTPFTLTLRNGYVLASLSHDEFLMDETFKVPFIVFDKVVTLEATLAVNATLDAMDRRLREAEAAREAQMQQAKVKGVGVEGGPEGAVETRPEPAAAAPSTTQEVAQEPIKAPAAAVQEDIRSLLRPEAPSPPPVGQARRRR